MKSVRVKPVPARAGTAGKLPVLGTNGYPLQDGAVYGPIHSRRLGFSLGINPLPVTYKLCDFDCVYCQYGWTPGPDNEARKTSERLKSLPILLSEIEKSFQAFLRDGVRIDVMTIAGNGEPTLYPQFLDFTKGLLDLRDRYYPGVRVGILSDASQCHRPEIKEALELLDERYMKLDGGDMETIRRINKPRGDFDFSRMVEALAGLRDVTIQSLFVQGSFDNTRPAQIEAWGGIVKRIMPKAVQVYTVDRPPADSGVKPVPVEVLEHIANQCSQATGIPTEVFD